jgi:hypothetical protein
VIGFTRHDRRQKGGTIVDAREAKMLAPGDRVVFEEGTMYEVHGTVWEVRPHYVAIEWDDNVPGYVHPLDMRRYTREVADNAV